MPPLPLFPFPSSGAVGESYPWVSELYIHLGTDMCKFHPGRESMQEIFDVTQDIGLDLGQTVMSSNTN